MRIIFLNTRYFPEGQAGPAFSVQHLAEQLAGNGHEVAIYCRTQRSGLYKESHKGVHIYRAGLNLTLRQVLGSFELLLDHFRPNVVHANLWFQLPVLDLGNALHQRGIKIAQSLRDVTLICNHGMVRDGKRCNSYCTKCHEAAATYRQYLARADAAVAVSRYILDVHREAGVLGSTPIQTVIHNSYAPATPLDAHVSASGILRLGYLGRLDPHKGIEMLLKTLTTTMKNSRWLLSVAGKGTTDNRAAPEYEQYLRRTYNDPRISFLGFVAQPILLNQVDVLVVPSLWDEALGRTVFEAYAHGIPVIASNRGGLPEMVVHGETGFMFDPDCPDELARSIMHLMTHPELIETMKTKALSKWREDFSPQVIAGQFERLYERVVSVG